MELAAFRDEASRIVVAASSQGRELTEEEDSHVLALMSDGSSKTRSMNEPNAAQRAGRFDIKIRRAGRQKGGPRTTRHSLERRTGGLDMQILDFSLRLGAAS